MANIAQVISWKFNDQAGMETRDGVITKFPGGIPSQSDQDTWTTEYANAKVEENETVRATRKTAYGDIGDQLDLLYKDMLADKGDKTGEWFKAVKAVKDANPKS